MIYKVGGFWAVESKITGEFLGFTGLHQQPEKFEFSPCTEIGWRLKRSAWGNGYASEAAVASFKYEFDILKLNEIVAFTACQNHLSESVMKRLGMIKVRSFEHPDLPSNHPLKQHLLYSINSEQYRLNKKKYKPYL